VREKVFRVAFDDPQRSSYPIQNGGLCARVIPITDAGRKRPRNEDSHIVLPLDGSGPSPDGVARTLSINEPGLLLVVADGMGGHRGGEVASRACVDNLAREIVPRLQDSGTGQPDLPSALQQAVVAAHRAVYSFAQAQAENQTMGTTLTAALVCGERADVAQVGDSRAYLFRNGNLILLTQDQTFGNHMRRRGEDPANVNPNLRELLIQAVGAQPEIDVVMTSINLEPQDLLLLCCDGLYKVVEPEELGDTLELEIPLAEKAIRLISRANENGGPDNITVILAEICAVEAAS
jgi:serine/threonine protein phosphatase PrpC